MFQIDFSEILVILVLILLLAPDKVKTLFKVVAGLRRQFKDIEKTITKEIEDLNLQKNKDED